MLHCSTPGNTLFYCSPPGNSARKHFAALLYPREHFTPLLTSREQCQEALCCTAQPQGTLTGNTLFYCSPPGTVSGSTLLHCSTPENTSRKQFILLLASKERCQGKPFIFPSSPPGTLPGNTSFHRPSPGNSATQGILFPFLGNIYIIFSLPIASKYTDRLQENFVFTSTFTVHPSMECTFQNRPKIWVPTNR